MEQNDIMLSICMIVKNEQRCLERCLKSIKPLKEHINCEVIVTDTGSTDKSVEIAEKYADKVLHFEWCNDFSAARNHGIEQAKGEWVMVMDADEELVEDVSHLVKFFNSEEKYRYTGAFCKMKNCFNAEVCNKIESLRDYKGDTSDFLAYRIFRRDLNPRYVGIIHEYMPYREPVYTIDTTTLYHDGYAFEDENKRKQKKIRNASLLEKQIKENLHDLRAVVHILVEEDVINKEVYKNLILLTEKLMYKNLNNIFVPNAFVKVARYYDKNDEKQKALKICQDYVKLFTGEGKNKMYQTFEIDIRFIQSNALFKQKQYRPALKMMDRYLQLMEKYQNGALDLQLLRTGSLGFANDTQKEFINFLKTRCYMELKEYEKAKEMIKTINLRETVGKGFYNFYWLIVRLCNIKECDMTLGEYYTILVDAMKREIPSQKKVAEDTYNMVHSYIANLPKEQRDVLLGQIISSEDGKADLWNMIKKKEEEKKESLKKMVEDTKITIKKLMAETTMRDKALDLSERLQKIVPEDEEVKEFIKVLSK